MLLKALLVLSCCYPLIVSAHTCSLSHFFQISPGVYTQSPVYILPLRKQEAPPLRWFYWQTETTLPPTVSEHITSCYSLVRCLEWVNRMCSFTKITELPNHSTPFTMSSNNANAMLTQQSVFLADTVMVTFKKEKQARSILCRGHFARYFTTAQGSPQT